jgi:hypothetical protein
MILLRAGIRRLQLPPMSRRCHASRQPLMLTDAFFHAAITPRLLLIRHAS